MMNSSTSTSSVFDIFEGLDDFSDRAQPEPVYAELQPVSNKTSCRISSMNVHRDLDDKTSVGDEFAVPNYSSRSDEFGPTTFSCSEETPMESEEWNTYYYTITDPHANLISETLRDLADVEQRQKNVDRLLEEELITISQADVIIKEKDKTRINMEKFLADNKKNIMFACFICARAFFHEEQMREHIKRSHISNKMNNFSCPSCDMQFRHRQHLNRHVLEKHKRDSGYNCVKCRARYATRSSLIVHLSRDHGLDENGQSIGKPQFECSNCAHKFGLEKELKRHESYCLRKEKIMEQRAEKRKRLLESVRELTVLDAPSSPVSSVVLEEMSIMSPGGKQKLDKTCPFCGLLTASIQSRNRHIERKHATELTQNPLVLEQKQYIKVNSPNLPFGCVLCAKRFSSHSSLMTHKKRSHENALPYVCDICKKSYPLQSELRKHKRRVHDKCTKKEEEDESRDSEETKKQKMMFGSEL